MEAKAFSFTHRTKVFADGTVRKNSDVYRPQPVRQVQSPKAGKPGEFRTLGIPTIYDRLCQ